MELQWEYDLPTDEGSEDYQYESPILIKDNLAYFITTPTQKDILHIVDVNNGKGKDVEIPVRKGHISKMYFFVEYEDKIYIYTDDFFLYQHGMISKAFDLSEYGDVNSYLLVDNRLFFSCKNPNKTLFCCNLDTIAIEWKIDISDGKYYFAGELSLFEGYLACYGQGYLLLIDVENGKIRQRIKLPRIDKLFRPIKLDEEHWLLGYTNGTNAGVLKYNCKMEKIVWRHKRKFQGPQLRCNFYQFEDRVFWVKNDTELVGVDLESGEEVYSLRTEPWLYTDLFLWNDNIIYGTSGADGYLNSVDARTGKKNWSHFLKNGCAYYDLYDETIIVGDFDKQIQQIDIMSGKVLQHLTVDGQVVGRVKVHKDCLYTIIWGNGNKNIRFVKVKL